MRPYIPLLISFVCANLTSCTERATSPANADAQAPPRIATTPTPSVDACTLLTSEEIEAVQGEPVQEGKPLLGIWIGNGTRIKPALMGSTPCREWTWQNIADFIDGL